MDRLSSPVLQSRPQTLFHQLGEPAVKVSIEFYAVTVRAIITRQLIKLAL